MKAVSRAFSARLPYGIEVEGEIYGRAESLVLIRPSFDRGFSKPLKVETSIDEPSLHTVSSIETRNIFASRSGHCYAVTCARSDLSKDLPCTITLFLP
jgi:hypothetical protein